MFPLERFLAASRLEATDCVQVAPFVTGHFMLWFAGIPEERALEYWGRDYERKLNAQLKTIEAFGNRFPHVMLWPGVWADFGPAIEPSSLGCDVVFPERTSPVPQPTIKDLEDIDRLQVPDPRKDGLMPLGLEALSYMVKKIPSDLKKQYGYGQWAYALGPTDIAGLSMGYDRFLIGLYKHPDSIHKLMKVAAETTVVWVEAQRDVIGSDLLVFISGDTDYFLNPTQFKIFSFPYISLVCKKLRKKGNIVLYHNDADTTHLLNDLGEVGANMFNYGQGMKTAVVKEKAGRKMGLVGGLNSIGVMLNGKAEDVRAEAMIAIREGAIDGGFVLSNEGGMASHTPWENITAMIDSVLRFRRYPL